MPHLTMLVSFGSRGIGKGSLLTLKTHRNRRGYRKEQGSGDEAIIESRLSDDPYPREQSRKNHQSSKSSHGDRYGDDRIARCVPR